MNTAYEDVTGIVKISVAGYKSICQEQAIDIAPLTLLAGANSSGKSSMMQPLLLLKQTLEARYNTLPLLLEGSHVKFTSTAQLFSQLGSQKGLDELEVIKASFLTSYSFAKVVRAIAMFERYTGIQSFSEFLPSCT